MFKINQNYMKGIQNSSIYSNKFNSFTFTEAWKSLTDKVKEARSNAQLKELSFEGKYDTEIAVGAPLIPALYTRLLFHSYGIFLFISGVNGLRMLGVVHEAVVFLLEQLHGSRHCRSYRFRFHKPEETDEPPLNPHGSARAEIHHRLEKSPLTHKRTRTSVVQRVQYLLQLATLGPF